MNFNLYKRVPILKSDMTIKSFKYKKYLKRFLIGRLNALGRSKGTIVMNHKGGGVKKKFRQINTYQEKISGIIRSVEHDPNRSCNIGLLQYKNGNFCNRIISSKNYVGEILRTFNYSKHTSIKSGDILKLKDIPVGIAIHNIESFPGSGSIYARAAGTSVKILSKGKITCKISFTSKRHMSLNLECLATIGICSNRYHSIKKKYKAGTNRLLNKRPVVRGVAMNPIDHPHGGGEGKGTPGRPSVSP